MARQVPPSAMHCANEGGGGGGWPLGLQPLNVRVGLVRNGEISGSLSFSTPISVPSPSSSSATSSDLDTESTGSFFHDRSITLGSLIGITSILELSSRSLRRSRRRTEDAARTKKSRKTRSWCSPCIRLRAQLGGETAKGTPSLGYFLEAERRSSDTRAKKSVQVSVAYELDGLPGSQSAEDSNTLFVDGLVAPPRANGDRSLALAGHVRRSKLRFSFNGDVGASHGVLALDSGHCRHCLTFPCMGRAISQSSHSMHLVVVGAKLIQI